MSENYTSLHILNAIISASASLASRKDEINRLNVFPVPDGDTGTNMSLTLESVVGNLKTLSLDAGGAEVRKAIVSGALMGARGNSGVITSQILRGFCEGSSDFDALNTESLAYAFEKAVDVAFQAVRKPVEGTMLTVLRDGAEEAKRAYEANLTTNDALDAVVEEVYASVRRTPDLLPVLKENGVVDAGGFGLAILFDGFAASLQGKTAALDDSQLVNGAAPRVEIEQIRDWDNSDYRYCNEFLVDSQTLDPKEALDFLETMGDCELCVGSTPKFKVHVHSNNPDQVLKYFLDRGQISEVHIHNMDIQSIERARKIAEEAQAAPAELKELGYVAVAAGEGNAEILKSLGVDVVVSGGQTMNPSTKDLLDAIKETPAEQVIVLPGNSNIIMAANSACDLSDKPCAVVPTTSVPQSFAAMFAVIPDAALEDNVESMQEAASAVRTGEVTTAVKNSRDAHKNRIRKGDIIGIADGSIEALGNNIDDVVMRLLEAMDASDSDNLTLLAGEDLGKEALDALVSKIEDAYPELEIDSQSGGQPLYPVVFSLE